MSSEPFPDGDVLPGFLPSSSGAADPNPSASDGGHGVGLRSLVIGSMPLLVAALAGGERVEQVRDALEEAGLERLTSFLGADLPKGAKVGFTVDDQEVRLVDERDDALLRAPRSGFDPEWLAAATRMKGTMFVAASGVDPSTSVPPADLAQRLDAAAADGRVLGAIVGVVEERPTLPLLFS